MIEVGHASHTGLRRDCNLDTYWADADLGLFLVVDGMGGPGRGDVAAAIARDLLVDAARTGRDAALAVRDASAAIAALAAKNPDQSPTGATLALLKVDGDHYQCLRVGDARIHLWHRGMLTSPEAGNATAADDAPTRIGETPVVPHRATHALGITPSDHLGATPVGGTLERGMQFLLCTDGLDEELTVQRIAATLGRTALAAQECVDHLVLDALEAGGRDNITAILVRVV